jgi:hypothetical protein
MGLNPFCSGINIDATASFEVPVVVNLKHIFERFGLYNIRFWI